LKHPQRSRQVSLGVGQQHWNLKRIRMPTKLRAFRKRNVRGELFRLEMGAKIK